MFFICGESFLFINLLHVASGFDESYSSLSYYYGDSWWDDDWKNVDQGIGIAFSLLISGVVGVILFTVFIAVCCVCYKQNQQLPTVAMHNGTHQTNISVIHPGQHSVHYSNPPAPQGVPYPHPTYGNHLLMTSLSAGPAADNPRFSFAPMAPAYQFHGGQSRQFRDLQVSASGLSPPGYSAAGLSAPSLSVGSSPSDQQGI